MYRIGICDDDRILCSELEEQIRRISGKMGVKAETEVWESGESLREDLEKGFQLDLLFLDIELVQANGVDVGRFIRNELNDMEMHIVYISSKQNYAMQFFKIQTLDFLIKPVSEDQLREVLSRSIRQRRDSGGYFEYQKGGSYRRIPLKEIVYFMSMDKKIRVVTKSGPEEFYGKLKEAVKGLPGYFMTIHQSYVVNQDFIAEYTYETVKLTDGEELSISRPYRKEVRERIREREKRRRAADWRKE